MIASDKHESNWHEQTLYSASVPDPLKFAIL